MRKRVDLEFYGKRVTVDDSIPAREINAAPTVDFCLDHGDPVPCGSCGQDEGPDGS